MIDEKATPEQIRQHGLEVLKRELGVVGMVRFMQQFTSGKGDYSVERHQLLDQLTPEEIINQIHALQQRNAK